MVWTKKLVDRLKAPINATHNYNVATDVALSDQINAESREGLYCAWCGDTAPGAESRHDKAKEDWTQDAQGNWVNQSTGEKYPAKEGMEEEYEELQEEKGNWI